MRNTYTDRFFGIIGAFGLALISIAIIPLSNQNAWGGGGMGQDPCAMGESPCPTYVYYDNWIECQPSPPTGACLGMNCGCNTRTDNHSNVACKCDKNS